MESKNYPSWRYNATLRKKAVAKDEAHDAESFKPENGWSELPYHEPAQSEQVNSNGASSQTLGEAHRVIEDAQREGKRILAAAEADADAAYDRVVDKAEEQADKIVRMAEEHAAKILAEAKQGAEQAISEAKQTAEQILAEANAKTAAPKEEGPAAVKTKGSK